MAKPFLPPASRLYQKPRSPKTLCSSTACRSWCCRWKLPEHFQEGSRALDATPLIEVNPENYEVKVDGAPITCQPVAVVPLAQRYFFILTTTNHMLIQQKAGTLGTICSQWPPHRLALTSNGTSTSKRILRKRSASGREISLRFLDENPALAQNDVLYEDARSLIVIDISPCDAIVVRPGSMYAMASVCYEIGNKHLPRL